jgi:hypothetical protein
MNPAASIFEALTLALFNTSTLISPSIIFKIKLGTWNGIAHV